MRVYVYYNLHRHCWSIKALEGPEKGRVIAHRDTVYLENVTFRVSEAGRQRVLRERKKNVHAGVVGSWNREPAPQRSEELGGGTKLRISTREYTYNPYKYDTFVNRRTEQPVTTASAVLMHQRRVYHAS